MTDYLFLTFVFLCAGVIAVPLASRFKLGSVLGYLIAGIAISPLLGLFSVDVVSLQHFAEFGVVMMLFLVGLELEPALLWKMRARLLGNVEPDEFVPIAESCGVFAMIDEWVIRTGLSSYPAIRNLLGRDFKLSLNISSAQLQLSNITEVLDRYARRFEIAPCNIQLEITETVNIEFTSHASAFLNRLSDAGYMLALDDFGAGFTSLLRIVEYPIKMVKFDKRFIEQTLKRGNRQILKPLVELCHSNGLLVTMEGAESQADIDLLSTFDCDYIQGYFLGLPISLTEMEDVLRKLQAGATAENGGGKSALAY